MSILNRRNAMLGWLTWLMTKRALKKKAKDAVPGVVEGSKRPNKAAIVSALAVLGGALWFWRRESSDDSASGEG